jgi:hypothetical protein
MATILSLPAGAAFAPFDAGDEALNPPVSVHTGIHAACMTGKWHLQSIHNAKIPRPPERFRAVRFSPPLSIGDYNLDGYPDVLAIVTMDGTKKVCEAQRCPDLCVHKKHICQGPFFQHDSNYQVHKCLKHLIAISGCVVCQSAVC